MPNTQPSPSKLVKLLRERLSRTDIRDYTAEYGEETEGAFNLYDRLVGQVGVNDAISALVAYAIQRDRLDVFVRVVVENRPDLRADIAALPQVNMQQAKEQLQPMNGGGNVNTGGGAYIAGDVATNGGVNVYGGSVGTITYVVQKDDIPPTQPIMSTPNTIKAQPTVRNQPIEVFYSYSHKDERYRQKLENQLSVLRRTNVIAGWHDRKITAGSEWKGAIDAHLSTAQIILLLISDDFVASDYCYDIELKKAMERHEKGEARVIPIILRPVDWKGAPFGKLQALPQDAKPITKWSSLDEGFENVAKGIRKAIEEIQQNHP